MSSKKPAATRQRTAAAVAVAGMGGAPPDLAADDIGFQPISTGSVDSEGSAGPSRFSSPTNDAESLVRTIQSLARQQEQQQQQQQEQASHNHKLYNLLERLSDKIEGLSAEFESRVVNKNGEDYSAPPQSDEEETVTAGGHREDDEGESSEEDEGGDFEFVDHTYYRHRIGEGFAQRQPSELAASEPAYFNIDDQVARSLADSKFAAKRSEYSITVANAFFAAIAHEAQKDAIRALEEGNYKTAHKLFKQVSRNLGATRDMQGDRMLFLNINSDPGATSKQKSFANDILRNDFHPGVTDRGGSARTQKKFQLYEEQCLKATLGASAKAQANKHLAAGAYNKDGAGSIVDKKRTDGPKRTDGKRTEKDIKKVPPVRLNLKDKKSEGTVLKDKGLKDKGGKKQVRFEATDSDSD